MHLHGQDRARAEEEQACREHSTVGGESKEVKAADDSRRRQPLPSEMTVIEGAALGYTSRSVCWQEAPLRAAGGDSVLPILLFLPILKRLAIFHLQLKHHLHLWPPRNG